MNFDDYLKERNKDHPRGCGEHSTNAVPMRFTGGSSPRMRGALHNGRPRETTGGIIPADAGSTNSRPLRQRSIQDHPRGCGEHTIPRPSARPSRGSSPRMRGARLGVNRYCRRMWIIPADAGSTASCTSERGRTGDHPRGCGEHSGPVLALALSVGSSPRMRGAPGDSPQIQPAGGIIPADAGSTVR